MSDLITCEEIAMLAGLTTTRIRQLGILPEVKQKTGKHVFLYDRSQALEAWHKKRDERRGKYTKAIKEFPEEEQKIQFIEIMKGDFDPPTVKQRHQLKKLASSYTKPKTTTVQLTGAWDIPEKTHDCRSNQNGRS